jgi:hypothetical protein
MISRSCSWLALLALAACGDPRRGGPGESCRATDDCEAPLLCLSNVCTTRGTDAGMTTIDAGITDAGMTDAGMRDAGMPDAGMIDAGPPNACVECIDAECATERAACGDECVAIDGCIQLTCANLSSLGSPDEGACQVSCQSLHMTGRQSHLDYVNCAVAHDCDDVCAPFPNDFEDCRAQRDATECAGELAACNGSLDCTSYRTCVSQCTTGAECAACDDDNAAGRNLAELYERCVSAECIGVAWIF